MKREIIFYSSLALLLYAMHFFKMKACQKFYQGDRVVECYTRLTGFDELVKAVQYLFSGPRQGDYMKLNIAIYSHTPNI